MRTLMLLSAIPGSGKSTWARKYASKHPHTAIISSDEIRVELFGKVNDFRDEKLVWETYLNRLNEAYDIADDVTVIADATNLQNKYRKYYHDMTPKFDRHVLVLFDVPYEICWIQNKMRTGDRVVPDAAMEKLRLEMEKPTPEILSLYDEVIVVTDVAKAIEKIIHQK